jgi:succinate dehydrogenase / fumarate reductase membrane anchor subunit
MATTSRTVNIKPNFETKMWRFMRSSGFLLIPLVWIHVLIKDVVHGVHEIDYNYVIAHWSSVGWQAYDIALLAFAFGHGMNGLRQVANDFFHSEKAQRNVGRIIFILWLVVSLIGAIAIIAAAQENLAIWQGELH